MASVRAPANSHCLQTKPQDKREKHKDEKQQWMEDLAKREKSKHSLWKRIPYFKDKREAFDMIYQYKVPVQRAIWFLKMHQLGEGNMLNQSKKASSKPSAEIGPGGAHSSTVMGTVLQVEVFQRN